MYRNSSNYSATLIKVPFGITQTFIFSKYYSASRNLFKRHLLIRARPLHHLNILIIKRYPNLSATGC